LTFTTLPSPPPPPRDRSVGTGTPGLQNVDGLRHFGALRDLVHVSQHQQAGEEESRRNRQRLFQSDCARSRRAGAVALSKEVL